MKTVNWLLQNQYLSNTRRHDCPPLNKFIESFSCISDDDYGIEGELGMPLPPFVAKFSKNLLHGHMLGVADEDGHVKLLDTRRHKKHAAIKEWSAHSNAVFDLAWIESEAKLVTASGDQTARLWDIEKVETVAIFKGHTCSLKSIAVQPQSNRVFITGARDGNILLWDTRCYMRNGFCNPMNTIKGAHVIPQKEIITLSGKKRKVRRPSMYSADSKQSVTAVVFQDNYTIVSSGACDGAIKFWDIRRHYNNNNKSNPVAFHTMRYPDKGPRKHGYSSLILDSTKTRLFAVCTNDTIYEYGISNLPTAPLHVYKGHSASSFYVKAALSPDDRFLLCGSSDSNAYIWKTGNSRSPPWVLKGHESEVTSVAWAPNEGEKIVTCSDDNMFKIWRMFDNTKDSSIITGKCHPTEKSKDLTIKNYGVNSTDQSEHVIDPCLKQAKPFCRPLDLCTNRRLTMKWIVPSPTRKPSMTSFISPSNKDYLKDKIFTHVTPKTPIIQSSPKTFQSKLPTPLVSFISTPAVRSKSPVTPKSSRSFMETWLKSPATPLNNTKNKTDINLNNSSNEADRHIKSEKPVKNKINDTPKNESYSVKKTPKTNDSLKVKSRNIRKNPTPKTGVNKPRGIMKDSENIRTLFNNFNKRARPPSESDEVSSKVQKLDKENDVFIKSDLDGVFQESKKTNVESDKPKRGMDLLDHAEEFVSL